MIKVPLWMRDFIKRDGSRELTADWDIGGGRMIQADKIRARDGDGLALYEDGGAGIFVKDGGYVGIGIMAPQTKAHVFGLGTNPSLSAANGIFYVSGNITQGLEFGESSAIPWAFWMQVRKDALDGSSFPLVLQPLGGDVGIGTMSPGNPLAVNRSADGTIVDFESADIVEGNISIAGNTTSYNAFMGSHYTQLNNGQKTPPIGAIVIATGEIIACEAHIEIPDEEAKKTKGKSKVKTITKDVSGIERKEYFSYVELASKKADKRVYGVYHAKMSDDAKGQSFGEDDKPIHQIAALGLYKVRVTDTNGNIETGDYIQSSIREGEGERQDNDIMHNYTVAKSIIDIDWSRVVEDPELGYKWKLIPATLHAG